jgi:hypothetical protein
LSALLARLTDPLARLAALVVDLGELLEQLDAWNAEQPWCPRCGAVQGDEHRAGCVIARSLVLRARLLELLEGKDAANPGATS